MEKLTKKLLIAFKNLCDKLPEQAAKQRWALGAIIANEAGELPKEFKSTLRSPQFGKIAAAFYEMLDSGWIVEVPVDEALRRNLYSDYKDQILQVYGTYTTNPEEMRRFLSKDWPFGDHWFRLTARGERVAERLVSPTARKIWFIIRDNAKTIIITVIGVLLARLIIYLMKIFFAYTR